MSSKLLGNIGINEYVVTSGGGEVTIGAPLAGGTANNVLAVDSTGTLISEIPPSVLGYVLTSNGPGSPATFQPASGGGSGTVTSVAAAGPTGLLTWSAAITSSGTLTATLATQTANYVFAGPTTGVAAAPTFRALVSADIPNNAANTTGDAAGLTISGQTGVLTFTGLTSTNRVKTVRDAADTLLELGGSYTPTGTWVWTSATVTWPTFNQNTAGTAANVTGVVAIANGGTNSSTALTNNQLMYSSGGKIVELGAMTNGQIVVGKTSNAPQIVTMGGDATISNTGSVTVGSIGGEAVSLAGAFTTSGAYGVTFTFTNTTTVTFPTSGTLATTSQIPTSANPSSAVGLKGVNGSAATFMTSDSAPPLSNLLQLRMAAAMFNTVVNN